MLSAPGALHEPDLRTLRTWLETDVRFVTVARRTRELDALPPEILHWLVPRRIVIPEPRHDELPSVIYSSVTAAAPGMEIHVTAIEEVLLETRRRGEDELLRRVGDRVRDLLARRLNVLRGGTLFQPEPMPGQDLTYAQLRPYPVDPDD